VTTDLTTTPTTADIIDAVQKAQTDIASDTVTILAVAGAVSCTTGDSQGVWVVPARLNGKNITAAVAISGTAGVTGTMDVQIRNATQAADVLSTVLTIDTTELDSSTAATPAVIDTAEDDLTTGDQICIDVDAVHSGTAAKGLWVVLTIG
jgi:hypothetical protein